MQDKPLRIALGPDGRKLLRLDQPTHSPAETNAPTAAASDSSGLWAMIWKKVNAKAEERRGGTRHEAVSHEIWLGWSTRSEFVSLDGLLLNISRGGALLILKERPPRDRPIWVYKKVCSVVPSVRGEVVATTPAPGGAFAVRVKFAIPCPTILCESAVCGDPSSAAPARAENRSSRNLRP